MNKYQMLKKLEQGKENISLQFFKKVIRKFGFKYDRTKGSHFQYIHENIPENINIQSQKRKKGQAIDYQIEQFIKIVKKYKL